MKRRKRCRCCHKLYRPHPPNYRRQKICAKEACRAQWNRQKWRRWREKHPLLTKNSPIKQKQWREKHRGYWKRWRKEHPGYVKRNRMMQKRRGGRKRGNLAKQTDWEGLCLENMRRIRVLRDLAKQTDWVGGEIVGIWRNLRRLKLLAKQTFVAP